MRLVSTDRCAVSRRSSGDRRRSAAVPAAWNARFSSGVIFAMRRLPSATAAGSFDPERSAFSLSAFSFSFG
jgi:hypothetical protein